MEKIDMTKGSITKKLLLFSLPIFLGNVFQQIYSLSDTLVVGRFLGKEALAAVGASSAIIVLVTSIIIGLCMGSSVLFAKLHAAKKHEDFSKAISTAIIFIVTFSILLSIILVLFLNPLLRLFNVPSSAFILSREYLYIVLSGIIFLALYNISAAMLRAIGDSKTPLVFLIISSVINVLLDFILVLYTPLGVKGPALSTLLAQIASGIPIFIYALKKFRYLDLKWSYNKEMFQQVWRYSILTSLQQSIMNFGILLVQGLVNSFGVIAVASFAIGVRIDAFAYMPAQDFGNAFAIYVAQNKGALKKDRISKGFKSALFTSTLFCGVISVFILLFANQLVSLFAPNDAEVIVQGAHYLRIEGLFYILIGYLFIFYAFYRGLGKMKTSILLTIISLGTRVFLSYTLVSLNFGLSSIWISIPIGWLCADIIGFIFYYKLKKVSFNLTMDISLSQ